MIYFSVIELFVRFVFFKRPLTWSWPNWTDLSASRQNNSVVLLACCHR